MSRLEMKERMMKNEEERKIRLKISVKIIGKEVERKEGNDKI